MTFMKKPICFAVCTLLSALCSFALAGDWTTVGGNSQRNGLSDENGPANRIVRWEARTASSTVAFQVYTWGDKLVTMRYDFGSGQGILVCHRLLSGDSLWTFQPWPGAKMLPIGFRDDRVYARNFRETQNDTLYCLDANDGSVLWQSRWTVGLGIIWSGAFTDDGDIVVPGGSYPVMCINHLTGDTVWTNRRRIPNTGAECLCVFGDRVFGWQGAGINTPKHLIALDANTGATLDTSEALPGDGDQEIPFSVGLDGTIFCQRDGGLFYAYRHTDSGFVRLWSRDDLLTATYSNYGTGPDSTLYVPSRTRIYRLNPTTGSLLDSSAVLASANINARISIDRNGDVYACVTTGQGEGHLYALTPTLEELWHEDIPYFYYSGPAIGQGGTTVISGPGTLLRAYQGLVAVADRPTPVGRRPLLSARPNPFRDRTVIAFPGPASPASHSVVLIHDAAGRTVRVLRTTSPLNWNGTDDEGRRLPPGIYFVSLGSERLSLRLLGPGR